jgi:hypothetical protein
MLVVGKIMHGFQDLTQILLPGMQDAKSDAASLSFTAYIVMMILHTTRSSIRFDLTELSSVEKR